jgi:hypothetical protein
MNKTTNQPQSEPLHLIVKGIMESIWIAADGKGHIRGYAS